MASTYLDRVDNKTLGQMLVEKGALSDEQVQEALDVARQTGQRLGEALVSLGYIGRDALSYAIAEQYGQRPMELHPSMVDVDLLAQFDAELLYRHNILPLIELGNEMVVVVADPNDQAGLDALSGCCPGFTLTPQMGEATQIRRCLESALPATTIGAAAPAPASRATAAVRLLSPFSVTPSPDQPEFIDWLFYTAAQNWGRDVIVRDLAGQLQVGLMPEETQKGGPGLELLGSWPGQSMSRLWSLLESRMTAMEHVKEQSWYVPQPARLGDDKYRFYVHVPLVTHTYFFRLVASRIIDAAPGEPAEALFTDVPATGELVAVEYDDVNTRESAILQLIAAAAPHHQIVVFSNKLRYTVSGTVVYPVPFADTYAVIQAHAATLVIFDHWTDERELTRITLTAAFSPAVVIFTPDEGHYLERLGSRPGARLLRLTSTAEKSTTSEGGNA
jgi:hypothetical protein